MVVFEALVPGSCVGAQQLGFRRLRQRLEVIEMAVPQLVGLSARLESFEGVFAHGFEHREAWLSAGVRVEQTLVAERSEEVERLRAFAADGLRCFERTTADEDGDSREHALFGLVEQRVAPLDRRAQGLLSRGSVPGPSGQEVEPRPQPLEQCGRAEQACPRCGQLDRQGKPVEPVTDRRDRRGVGVMRSAADRAGTLKEERDRRVGIERRHRQLALAREPKHGAARDHCRRAG